jgi:hypothetical protein
MATQKPSLLSQKPAASSATNTNKAVVDAKLSSKLKVTYKFKITTTGKLWLPYAVAVNGTVLPEFSANPRRASAPITVVVDPGSTVTLFLNSDAHVKHRTTPVYAISPKDNDVEVTITEKTGKHADADTPVFKETKEDAKKKKTDYYTAPLTGDIWMKISHKYTAGEAEGLIPADVPAEIRAAVKKIYDGSLSTASPKLTVEFPATKDAAALSLTVTFEDSANPRTNITSYELFADGLPRVHPLGFVALLQAARDSGLTKMNVTSCWRPLLGSIAHRIGLGLDVNHVATSGGKTRFNREELRGKGGDSPWVSEEEKKRLRDLEAAENTQQKAEADLKKANKERADYESKIKKKTVLKDAKTAAALEEAVKKADKDVQTARAATAQAKKDWEAERDANEPDTAKNMRASLLRCRCVKQLFDPWMMDGDTKDAAQPVANRQETKNETLHAHHLHITIDEPGLL